MCQIIKVVIRQLRKGKQMLVSWGECKSFDMYFSVETYEEILRKKKKLAGKGREKTTLVTEIRSIIIQNQAVKNYHPSSSLSI